MLRIYFFYSGPQYKAPLTITEGEKGKNLNLSDNESILIVNYYINNKNVEIFFIY